MTRRVLFGWELGEGNGHLRPYLSLLHALSERGWEVGIAQRNTAVSATELAATGWPIFQSPVCLNEFTGIAPNPASHTEIFLGFGFAHTETLMGLVSGWRALFRSFEPDLVIGNYAPTLMLAAHASAIPAIRLGTGFDCPPHEPRTPLFQAWTPGIEERLARAEALALRTANAVMRLAGLPALSSLGKALEGDATLLATLPALDHFAPRGSAHEYLGPMPVASVPGEGGEPPEIFVSLPLAHPHSGALLQAIASSGRAAWAYMPDATAVQCAQLSTGKLRVSSQPFEMTAALSACCAVVSYGGHGLALSALLAGRPLLIMPDNGERQCTARRVEALGVGIAVGVQERPKRVAAALARLLGEAAFGEAARTFAQAQPADIGAHSLLRAVAACESAASPAPAQLKVVRS